MMHGCPANIGQLLISTSWGPHAVQAPSATTVAVVTTTMTTSATRCHTYAYMCYIALHAPMLYNLYMACKRLNYGSRMPCSTTHRFCSDELGLLCLR